jgi:uncharacterized protein YutE (UPF0331/DUF86 family)
MLPGIEFGQWISALTLSEALHAILGYVRALAWPLTVAFCAWIFRGPLASLLTRLTKFSAFGVESNFNDQARFNAREAVAVKEAVEEARESAGDATGLVPLPTSASEKRSILENPKVSVGPAEPNPARSNSSFTVDEQDPSILGVFISRWNRLEQVAEQAFDRLDHLQNVPGPYRRIANLSQTFTALAGAGFVPLKAAEVAEQTQRLRNDVVHGHKDLSLDALDDVLTGITALEQTLHIASGRMLIAKTDMNRVIPQSEWR